MKTKQASNSPSTLILLTRRDSRLWQWDLVHAHTVIAGGYCRTKADALNDASIAAQARINYVPKIVTA